LRLGELRDRGEGTSEIETDVTIAGQRRNLLVAISWLDQARGEGSQMVAVLYDITRLREFERRANRQARLSEMGNLAAGVAHEIRNPLNAIAIATQRLAAEFEPQSDAETYRSMTEQIRQETRRLNSIITRFLTLAREEKQQGGTIEVDTFLQDVVRFLEPEANELGVSLVLKGGTGAKIAGHPDQLRQVVLNLFNNAKEVLAEQDGTIEISAEARADSVEIRFADNGPGISVEWRDEVFKPYYTTKDAGTGLGLTTVHRIVTDMGGEIQLGDAPTGGAQFVIRLPRASE
jgi:signal transduction histidine kinase